MSLPHQAVILQFFLRSKNFRQYNIPLAKALGKIEYAILLTDLIDQYFHLAESNQLVSHLKYGDGLMFYTIKQAYDRCAICRDSFESAVKLFIKLGFIKDAIVFGIPPRTHFRIDFEAIYNWIISNNFYNVRNSASLCGESSKSICVNPQRNEPNNESKNEPNNRLQSADASAKKSSFFQSKEIVSFDPSSYRLRDGKNLGKVMARTLAKRMKDPNQSFIILSNVEWYEKQIDKGIIPKKSHEVYLQFAINKNLASKENSSDANRMYANFIKQEYNLHGMKIMKTVVQLDKRNGSKPESVSLNLPFNTFESIIDNFMKSNTKALE